MIYNWLRGVVEEVDQSLEETTPQQIIHSILASSILSLSILYSCILQYVFLQVFLIWIQLTKPLYLHFPALILPKIRPLSVPFLIRTSGKSHSQAGSARL